MLLEGAFGSALKVIFQMLQAAEKTETARKGIPGESANIEPTLSAPLRLVGACFKGFETLPHQLSRISALERGG